MINEKENRGWAFILLGMGITTIIPPIGFSFFVSGVILVIYCQYSKLKNTNRLSVKSFKLIFSPILQTSWLRHMITNQSRDFISKVEEIKPAKELFFKPTLGFGKYDIFFPKEAVVHPAKANISLLEYLIENYTNEGDTVLDPMAGTFSTVIIAALHGRNGIGIELEERFVNWGLQAKELVERSSTLNTKGQIEIIKGDTRALTLLVDKKVDAIITSPPYAISNLKTKRENYDRDNIPPRWKYSIKKYVLDLSFKNIMLASYYTYIVEMLKVYSEMYKVLKQGGKAVIIIRPFIKNKKVIDLPFETHRLLSRFNFILDAVFKLRLPISYISYWRQFYYTQYPDFPRMMHEYILVYRKS